VGLAHLVGFAGAHPLVFVQLAFVGVSVGDAVPVHFGISEQRGRDSPGLGLICWCSSAGVHSSASGDVAVASCPLW
jgi:hypothetical protein